MPNGDATLLRNKVFALELMMTWLIANHAHTAEDPREFIRTLSNDLSGIIDHASDNNGTLDPEHAASVQHEVDNIIKKAGSLGWLDGS